MANEATAIAHAGELATWWPWRRSSHQTLPFYLKVWTPMQRSYHLGHVRRTASAAALAATTVLLLSACRSSTSSDGMDKIAGADAATQSASPTPSAKPDGIDRPKVVLPHDMKNVFEGWATGDPKKDAVLVDSRWHINSVDAAVTNKNAQTKDFPAVDFYTKDAALLDAYQYIASFYKAGESFTGQTAITTSGSRSKAMTLPR